MESAHAVRTRLCPSCGWTETYPLSCGDRLCPICSRRGYARSLNAVMNALQAKGIRIAYPKFMTLTIIAGDDLAQQYRDVRGAWNHLRRQTWFKKACAGGFFVPETTLGPSGWHVHLHILMEAHYLPREKIQAEWLKLTGAWNVDIRALYGGTKKAVMYVLKYMLSPPVLDGVSAGEFRNVMHGKRMLTGFGKFYDVANTKKYQGTPDCPRCGSELIIIERTERSVLDEINQRIKERLRRVELWKLWSLL